MCSLISAGSQTALSPPLQSTFEDLYEPSPTMAVAMSAPLVDMAKAVITDMGNLGATADGWFGESPPLGLSSPKVPLPPPLPPQQPKAKALSKLNARFPSNPQMHHATSTLPPSLVSTAKNKGIDVTIIVGKGSEQRAFPHNSHVLRYISDYFGEVMVHSSNSVTRPASSSSNEEPQDVQPLWTIDFSHKKVEEWKAFYPFLEPPVKRTVSLDVHNLPVLLPWFHEFQLPLLLHQCDTMLSSLYFPNLQQNPQPGDLQDCLLYLYAALSCDLPQTQQLGVQVLGTYLRGAPHLFLPGGIGTSTSSLQRLIILLQCFPHFQKQVWDPSIKPFLPPDLDTCGDVDSPLGRDWMLQNPLFLFVLREGISKYTLKRSSPAAESCSESRYNGMHSEGRRDQGQTKVSHISIGTNTFLATRSIAGSDEPDSPLNKKDLDLELGSPMISQELRQGPHLLSSGANSIQQRNSWGIEEGRDTDKSLTEESPCGLMEMSHYLGQQFWGAGWNLEPRASQEQEQRRLDRRSWLEAIVHKLKEHAQPEKQSSEKLQHQWQNSQHGQHAPDPQGAGEYHPLASAQQDNRHPRKPLIRLSNEQPSLHAKHVVAVDLEAKRAPAIVALPDRGSHHRPHQAQRHHRLHHVSASTTSSRLGGNEVKSFLGDSGSGLVTATTDPISLSGLSVHTVGTFSNDSFKRTFRC